LWAKALAEGEGSIEKAKGLYIKLRVEMIQDEWAYAEKILSKEAKKRGEASDTYEASPDHSRPAPNASLRRWMFALLLLFLIPLSVLLLFIVIDSL
jgi:hypothetical protein